jgi:hypothetical protein
MTRSDSTTPWRRKHDGDNPAVQPAPALRFYPTTLDDLIQIVSDAEVQGKEVRASGSHWALSKAAVTDGFAVETQAPEGDPERLNKTLYDVIPGCMRNDALRFFTSQGVGPFDPDVSDPNKIYLYHVESGTRIYELYSRLDVGDDEQKASLAHKLGFGPSCDYRGPWAMSTLGGAGGQTIVGAFSTGTHGGDKEVAPIADAVQAIHLVGPGGVQHWIERQLPNGGQLVDEDLLQARYPKIKVHRDEEMLAAVVIAAGRMGIIYSVVLRAIRQYALSENRRSEDWSSVKKWVTNMAAPGFMVPPALTTPYRFMQIVINPNGQHDNKSEHTCYVTGRQRLPLNSAGNPPVGRAERAGPAAGNSAQLGKSSSLTTAICSSNDWVRTAIDHEISDTNDVRNAALATAAAAIVASWVPFIDPATRAFLLQTAAVALGVAVTAKNLLLLLWKILDHILPPFGTGTFGDELAALANWCADNDHFEIFRRVAEYAFKQDQEEATQTAVSYAVMDIHNYLDTGCSAPGDSIEIFMNATDPRVITFVDRLLQRVDDLANGILDNGTPRAFAGYLSLRYTADSFALLGMQRFNPTVSFEVAGLGRVHGTEPFLRAIEADAVSLGGALHWGQRNNQKMKNIQEIWKPDGPSGKLFLWRKWLSELSENGRLHAFSTTFTRELGLEIVQPILANFFVGQTTVAAGEKTRVTWEAKKNPPGTRVLLFIRPAGSTTPVDPSLVTSDLAGFRDITVSRGQWTFTLAVTLHLNGEVHQDERTIDVIGFADHEVLVFELTAECMPVNGASRWAAPLSLGSQFISNNLLVEELVGTTGTLSKWTARPTSRPDIPFGPASPSHAFTVPPIFNRDWLFFLDTPGCTGTPPVFHLEFKLVSNL